MLIKHYVLILNILESINKEKKKVSYHFTSQQNVLLITAYGTKLFILMLHFKENDIFEKLSQNFISFTILCRITDL